MSARFTMQCLYALDRCLCACRVGPLDESACADDEVTAGLQLLQPNHACMHESNTIYSGGNRPARRTVQEFAWSFRAELRSAAGMHACMHD